MAAPLLTDLKERPCSFCLFRWLGFWLKKERTELGWLSGLRTRHSVWEEAGSIPGLAQWVKGSGVAVAVVRAGSGSSDPTPSLGTSTCSRFCRKERREGRLISRRRDVKGVSRPPGGAGSTPQSHVVNESRLVGILRSREKSNSSAFRNRRRCSCYDGNLKNTSYAASFACK